MKITNKAIREYLGHDGVNCRVIIKRNGDILRYGSSDHCDRSSDYWHDCGCVEDIQEQIKNENNQ